QLSISGRSIPEDRAAIPPEPSTADRHQPHPVLPDRQPFLGNLKVETPKIDIPEIKVSLPPTG
ncbi:hypothetical protein LKL35_36700, partial [Streptomyces sp. ET3-23]|uniref:hypothetical protein n=1 Tax=Streptomyces sp. ET3-23 TaxID=2885643 RepID=UPI001D1001D2